LTRNETVFRIGGVPVEFTFADAIRKVRDSRGMTIEDLARKAGVNKGTVSEIERGTANPTQSTLESLAKALDTSLAMLYQMTTGGQLASTPPPHDLALVELAAQMGRLSEKHREVVERICRLDDEQLKAIKGVLDSWPNDPAPGQSTLSLHRGGSNSPVSTAADSQSPETARVRR
jgi:transcriptional regulator with XRE-family HTH domain